MYNVHVHCSVVCTYMYMCTCVNLYISTKMDICLSIISGIQIIINKRYSAILYENQTKIGV